LELRPIASSRLRVETYIIKSDETHRCQWNKDHSPNWRFEQAFEPEGRRGVKIKTNSNQSRNSTILSPSHHEAWPRIPRPCNICIMSGRSQCSAQVNCSVVIIYWERVAVSTTHSYPTIYSRVSARAKDSLNLGQFCLRRIEEIDWAEVYPTHLSWGCTPNRHFTLTNSIEN